METEPNDTPALASPTVTSGVFRGSVEAGGRDCVAVDVPAGAAIFAQAQLPDAPTCPGAPTSADPLLTIYGPTGATVTSQDDTAGFYRCPVIDPFILANARNLAAGRYAVCVTGFSSGAVPNYLLTVGVVR
jgi:hypothetical protein